MGSKRTLCSKSKACHQRALGALWFSYWLRTPFPLKFLSATFIMYPFSNVTLTFFCKSTYYKFRRFYLEAFMISRLIIVHTMISRLIFDNISRFRRCNIDLLWRHEIKLHKALRPGDSVDDSGVVVSVGGSVGILMHTPS